MKRTLLFLFCALISTQMFSETLFGYLFPTLAYLERTSCHYMEGYEQNRTINRLSFEDNMFEIDGNYYIEYNGFCLREDKEGRILVYSHPTQKDLVLYDFTLEVGDTLTTLNADEIPTPVTEGDPISSGVKYVVVDYPIYINGELSCPIDTLIVTDVSMVMMCDSNQYKKWTFSNGMEYMEYIGNLGADFFPIIRNPWEDVPTCCVEEHLVCASIYDRLVYLMDDEKRDLLNIDCPCTSWSNKWQWRTNTWNVLQFDGMAFEQTAQTWQYKLAHDTIIGGKEYTAITRHWTAYDESAAEYVAAVRFTENKKAFIYYDNAEYLLYDFGYHEIGDTLEVFSGINNYMHFKTYKCVITDNYSTAGGIAEDTYVMDIIHPITGDTIPSALVWQEFVGSYSGFLHGGLLVPGNSNYQLLCAYKDNALAYSVDNDAFTDNDTFIEYGCEYNANDVNNNFNEPLIGQWRGVDRDLIVSISDSIISIEKIGLSHKYIASATQLQIERLWAQEDEPHRSANCDYWLHGDTLWIDSIVPSLAEIYPPIFGSITLVRVKNEELFPTLAGLQRTTCLKNINENEVGTVWGSRSYLMQEIETTTIDGKQYLLFGTNNTYDEYCSLWLREENNKILVYSAAQKKDLVLYDFTLNVGDSLPRLYVDEELSSIVDYYKYEADWEYTKPLFVTEVSTITLLDGKEYKKWTFDNGMEYVEGIGSFGTSYAWNDFYQLIANGPLYSDVFSQHLVCASKNGQLLYKMDESEMAQLETECLCKAENPEDLFPTLWGLQRTSCDEWFEGCGENKSYLFAPKEVKEINGKLYLKCGGVFLREEDSKVLIYSFPYEKDFVLYDYTLEVGGTLQNLGIDIYSFPELEYAAVVDYIAYEDYDVETDEFIIKKEPLGSKRVTEVSTITLLDGKEYKRWLFGNDWENGNYYVEGIGNVGGSFGGDYINIANPYALPTCYMGEHLVCVSKNNKLLYMMDDAEMEQLETECLCEVETSYKSQWCNKWNVMWFDGMRFDETASTSQYRLGKDTVIGDYTYSKFTSRTSVRFTDDKKVYVYYEGFDDNDPYTPDLPTGEYLAYDFSAQVGDTLEVFSGIGTYSTYPCVVDDVQIDSETNLRTMTLHKICRIEDDGFFEEYDDMEMTWIEGVGSPEGFLISYRPCGWVGGGTYALLCAYQDDELKYTDSFYERFGCDYKAGVVSDDLFPTLSGLQRTICREYCEQADNKTRIEQFTNLTTRTETGGPYLYCSPFLLREKDNKILIYSRTLNKDLVLYDFNLQVGDSLPMLYIDFFAKDDWIADSDMEIWCVVDYYKDLEGNILPADTLIVTDVSAITLLDGKEYKKWTFNNGMEYVEGIGSFGNRQWSGDFFQLIGNMDIPVSLHGEHLVCASRNGKLLYQMDDEEMERLGAECLCEIEPKWSETWCNQWNILSHGYQGPQDPLAAARTSIFWLSNNTVNRDGQEYIPLMCSSSKPDVESTNLIGELRFTEDKQVYFYYDNTEYLLYDFGAQVGDQLQIFSGIDNYNRYKTYTHVVTRREYLEDGRIKLTSIPFFDEPVPDVIDENYYLSVTWIEGVGSEHGIVHNNINYIPGMGTDWLLCAYRDGECRYTTDDPEYAPLGCVYNDGDFIEDAFPILSGLQRTVCNEYCGDTEDDNSANNTYKQTFDSIFFENDKPYILCNDYLLREEDNKILIYSQLLNKDLVLYDFTLEVGDSLPALYIDWQYHNAMDWIPYNLDVVDYNKDFDGTIYPADTFVVTDVSNVTLLDGKEYKKWTFDNGMEYVEGIGMYGGRRNGNFFGLIQEVVVPCHTGTHLVCVSKNGQLLYKMDDAEMERLGAECLCDYDNGPRKDNAKNGKIGGRPTPTQWNMLEVDLREMEHGNTILRAETFSYTLENDSIVANGKTFYQLARQSTRDTAITKSFVGALHFSKDEGNRVYFLCDGEEYLLYDFTAEPGDTVEIFAGINNYPQETTYSHVVRDKDTLENGACRMFLEVVFPDETNIGENTEKVWLAGLGSVDGIVHNATKQTRDAYAAPSRSARSSETHTSIMLCAWREDSCLYTTDHPDYDNFGCVYNQDPTSVSNTPSPMTDCQKLLVDGQLLIIYEGKTYNVLGMPIQR